MRRDALHLSGAAVLLLAATLSFGRVFIDNGWFAAGWGAAGLSLAVAFGAHRLRWGLGASAVASTVAFLAFTYLLHLAAGGLLPGRADLTAFTQLWSQGLTDLVQEPAPARTTPGLMVIVSTSVWWLAHAVHEMLVRWRRPGPGIVLAACLWTAPLAAPQPPGRTWPQALPFLVAAGYVLLLQADPDIAASRRSGGRSLLPTSSALVVGTLAVVVGLGAPGVLPGYGAEPWFDVAGGDAARGYQPIVDVSRRLKLPQPRDLLRVEADRPLYLRLAGLDTFDGATWRLGPPDRSSFSPDEVLPADRELPPEVPIGRREQVQVVVENLSLENVFVPVPYHPVRMDGSSARRMVYSQEGAFIATSDTLEGEPALVPGLSYVVHSALPTPSAADLRAISYGAYRDPRYSEWLALPRDYTELQQVTRAVLEEAGARTPSQAAFALQEHFRDRGRFRYSTDVPALRDGDALTRFVTTDRVGYCEYYATAMAVMLRLAGIPSRVAVGFRLGDETAPGEYVVTTDDAHAWVEALFPGYGWIQFEPTPALADALVPTPDDVTPRQPVGRELPRFPDLADTAGVEDEPVPDTPDLQPSQPAPDSGGTPIDDARRAAPALVIALAAVLGLAAVTAARMVRRARRRHDRDEVERVLDAQQRVYRAARGYGVARRSSETARDVAARWTAEGRVDAAAARRWAELSQAAAFGGLVEHGDGHAAEALGDGMVLRLRGSVPPGTRWFAPLRVPVEDSLAAARRAAAATRRRAATAARRRGAP